jgi:hypothetical protein
VTPDEERDAALIDRLYGDAPGGDDELGELRTVRALIARVREEAPVAEPSPAIAATLLAAARERAPKEGLWARFVAWMSPVTAHPGLAAAATLVVVVGATALWMRDGGKVAEPTYEASDRRPAAAEEPKQEEKAPVDEYETAGTVLTPVEEEPGAKADAPKHEPAAPAKPSRKAPPPAKGEREERALEATGETTKEEKPAVVVTGRVEGQVGGSASGGDVERTDKKKAPQEDVAPTTTPPPPPPAPAQDSQLADDDEGGGAEETVTVNERDSSSDQARAVTRKARAEAEKNNCKNTATYGTEVRNLDRGVYDRDFVKDRAIDACLRRERSKSQTKSGQ